MYPLDSRRWATFIVQPFHRMGFEIIEFVCNDLFIEKNPHLFRNSAHDNDDVVAELLYKSV